MRIEIPNTDLKDSNIPSPNAPWKNLITFALSFNGYNYSEECAELANNTLNAFKNNEDVLKSLNLSQLRACLFFEQRRWRHFDENPDDKTMVYIHHLIEAIREKVKAQDFL
jgi:hypothetical protein